MQVMQSVCRNILRLYTLFLLPQRTRSDGRENIKWMYGRKAHIFRVCERQKLSKMTKNNIVSTTKDRFIQSHPGILLRGIRQIERGKQLIWSSFCGQRNREEPQQGKQRAAKIIKPATSVEVAISLASRWTSKWCRWVKNAYIPRMERTAKTCQKATGTRTPRWLAAQSKHNVDRFNWNVVSRVENGTRASLCHTVAQL